MTLPSFGYSYALSIWDTIKSFFSEPLGGDSIASEVESPLVKVLHPLDVLRHEALKEESQVEDHQAAHQSEEEKQALREHQEALLQDILSLHNRLSTGLSLDALRPMVDALRKHCQDYRTYRSGLAPSLSRARRLRLDQCCL